MPALPFYSDPILRDSTRFKLMGTSPKSQFPSIPKLVLRDIFYLYLRCLTLVAWMKILTSSSILDGDCKTAFFSMRAVTNIQISIFRQVPGST